MDIQQLRDELSRRGIAFAANAGIANLQAKLDQALAVDEERAAEAKQEEEEALARQAAGETPSAKVPDAEPEKPEPVKAAAPAAEASTAPAAPATEAAIPEAEISAKVSAGLTRDQAIEVITTQRAHDKQLSEQ